MDNKSKIRIIVLLLAIIFLAQAFLVNAANVIDKSEYILYVPSGVDPAQKYPLVIAFSPSADAQLMINTWKKVAEDYKWIIFSSKEFRNGIDPTLIYSRIESILKDPSFIWPIDKSKIIATGLSGGGMGSHFFVCFYPGLINAVVINTGMMDEQFVSRNDIYPKNKIAVFLASPTDFRYQEMKRDKNFLESVGWKTKWIEFEGGHVLAPEATYQEAAGWLQEQFKNK
jgi:predicted peptidase